MSRYKVDQDEERIVESSIFSWAYIKRRIQYAPWENEIK
jgi:hypothetical protein